MPPMNNTFEYKFSDDLIAKARHWINPDGSQGGIVSTEANIASSATISKGAIVFP
ncbi:UDP-3-O-(3-hydroxymyristoyl)glucosamine N-acyltransferase, partial [Xylella fastidiosa]